MGLETSEAFVEWLRPNSLCTENKTKTLKARTRQNKQKKLYLWKNH